MDDALTCNPVIAWTDRLEKTIVIKFTDDQKHSTQVIKNIIYLTDPKLLLQLLIKESEI